jgi:hypothetical protein
VTLELDPGVALMFTGCRSLVVSGTLRAIGTAQKPILFTSYRDVTGGAAARGDWKQVLFRSSSTENSLVYCEFRWGGYCPYNSYPMVRMESCSPAFEDCVFRESSNQALYCAAGAHPLLQDCQIYNNSGAAIYADVASMPTWEGDCGLGAVHDNAWNGIYLGGGTISLNTHWACMGYDQLNPEHGIPFFMGDNDLTVASGVTLELDPGVALMFTGCRSLVVSGTLRAIGTAQKPILFTSYRDLLGGAPVAGDWKQILFTAGSDGGLAFCEIRYAGYCPYNYFDAIVLQSCAPVFEHCTFTNCTRTLIHATSGATPTIWYSSLITGSTGYCGVSAGTGATADARFCFWGAPSGPYHATLNPAGAGSCVTDGVQFEPWWTDGYGPTASIQLSPPAFVDTLGQGAQIARTLSIHNADDVSVLCFSIGEAVGGDAQRPSAGGDSPEEDGGDAGEQAEGSAWVRAEVPWLSVWPESGVAGPGETLEIQVALDAESLELGDFAAYLVIFSNDALNSPAVVPVHLVVSPADVGEDGAPCVAVLAIGPVSPNPFGARTAIHCYLPDAKPARLTVHDILGRCIRACWNDLRGPGEQTMSWDGRDDAGVGVPCGVYYLRLEGDQGVRTRPVVLAR